MNTEGVFDAAEKVMYLSGAPLHVITSELAAKWATAMDWREPLSFSAGVDSKNVAEVVANGCAPVTTCTDLLKPGGYGRLTGYLTELKAAMEAVGARTINQYVRARAGGGLGLLAAEFAEAGVALDAAAAASLLARAEAAEVPGTRAVMCPAMPGKAALEALASGGGSAADLAAVLDRATRRGMLANWKAYAAVVVTDDRYAFARNNRAPKKIKSHLDTFDCINCDKCIPACPNDAMFSYEVAPVEVPLQAVTFVPGAGFKVADLDTAFAFKKEHQLANFADWCNECSNCQTYCPEQGGPFIQKPRFYGDRVAFLVGGDDGYYLETHGGIDLALLRVNGVEYEFEWRRDAHRATLRDEFMIVEYDTRTHKVVEAFLSQVLNNERTVDSSLYHLARTMVEGVLHSAAPNPVSARVLAAT
jgi:putative selenate reductase